MPKIGCRCGNVISLSKIPCPHGFLLRSESDLIRIVAQIVRLHEHPDEVNDFEMTVYDAITPTRSPAPHVYQCTDVAGSRFSSTLPATLPRCGTAPEGQGSPPTSLASLYDAKIELGKRF